MLTRIIPTGPIPVSPTEPAVPSATLQAYVPPPAPSAPRPPEPPKQLAAINTDKIKDDTGKMMRAIAFSSLEEGKLLPLIGKLVDNYGTPEVLNEIDFDTGLTLMHIVLTKAEVKKYPKEELKKLIKKMDQHGARADIPSEKKLNWFCNEYCVVWQPLCGMGARIKADEAIPPATANELNNKPCFHLCYLIPCMFVFTAPCLWMVCIWCKPIVYQRETAKEMMERHFIDVPLQTVAPTAATKSPMAEN